jgi:hypothetical protein
LSSDSDSDSDGAEQAEHDSEDEDVFQRLAAWVVRGGGLSETSRQFAEPAIHGRPLPSTSTTPGPGDNANKPAVNTHWLTVA